LPLRGWLKNRYRRDRREKPQTLTDEAVKNLIQKIDSMEWYVKKTLGREIDMLVRLRDKALIAMAWTFFKRGGEILSIKRKDVMKTDRELLVTFNIFKKKKRVKICPQCNEPNSRRSIYCKKCGSNIASVGETIIGGGSTIVTKRKTLKYPFTRYICDWLEAFDKLTDKHPNASEYSLFPPLKIKFQNAVFNFKKRMTIQNFDKILQKLDPSLTSCHFRYGGAEKYLLLGYSPHELREIGDWETSKMPEIYAKRKGLTKIQIQWSEDIR